MNKVRCQSLSGRCISKPTDEKVRLQGRWSAETVGCLLLITFFAVLYLACSERNDSSKKMQNVSTGRVALVDAGPVLGFEDMTGWTAQSATLSSSALHTEGQLGLSVAMSGGWSSVTSTTVTPPAVTTGYLAFDLLPSPNQGTSNPLGLVQLKVVISGVETYLGQVSITQPIGQFQRMVFPVSSTLAAQMKNAVAGVSYKISIQPNAGTYVLDHLRFITDAEAQIPANPTDPVRVKMFESPTIDWYASNGATADSSSTRVEGAASLAVVPRNGYTPIASAPIHMSGPISASGSLDIFIPVLTPSPSWAGVLDFTVSSASLGMQDVTVVHQDLGILKKGQFNRIAFTVPATVVQKLVNGVSDLVLRLVLNVQPDTRIPYLFDRLVFDTAKAAACASQKDGTACDDDNACTTNETCQSGICRGGIPIIADDTNACTADVCDSKSGVIHAPVVEKTSCSDGNVCNGPGLCDSSGVCEFIDPIICIAPDACHDPGACDPATGTCLNPPVRPDGTACSDSNDCTQTDTCRAGSCVGTDHVQCIPSDECHVAGSCDPATGMCSNPAAPDGTVCGQDNCLMGAECQAGECVEGVVPSPVISDTPEPSPGTPIVATDETTAGSGVTIGATTGNFSVTSGGAASYTIPLWTSPGRGGIEPNLALSYTSNNTYGSLGVGFQLVGFPLSRITRCVKTIAQDGFAAPVEFTKGDALCLDGNRLIQMNDGTYRTEQDEQSRITITWRFQGEFPIEPESFKVERRDGWIVSYGGTGDSRLSSRRILLEADKKSDFPPTETWEPEVTYSWAVDSVQDRYGNRMQVSYNEELLPSEIKYTSNPQMGLDALRRVAFEYVGIRSIAGEQWVSGAVFNQNLLLMRIAMYTQDTLVRSYMITYEQSPATRRDRIESLSECDGVGICKQPTLFEWEDGDSQYDDIDTKLEVTARPPFVVFDADNDGRDDIIYYPSGSDNGVLMLSSGDKDEPFGSPSTLPTTSKYIALPIDRAMTGIPDLLLSDLSQWKLAEYVDGQYVLNADGLGDVNLAWAGRDVQGDFNGDALPDLMALGNFLQLSKNDKGSLSGFGALRGYAPGDDVEPMIWMAQGEVYVASIDGSGRSSLLFRNGTWSTTEKGEKGECLNIVMDHCAPYTRLSALDLLPNGKARVMRTTLYAGFMDNDNTNTDQVNYGFVDVNGDGLDDALRFNKYESPQKKLPMLAINTGRGFRASTEPFPEYIYEEEWYWSLNGHFFKIADFNLDGLSDVIVVGYGNAVSPDDPEDYRTNMIIYLSRPDGTMDVTTPMIAADSSGPARPIPIGSAYETQGTDGWGQRPPQTLDWNGDGLPDIIQSVEDENENYTFHLYVRRGAMPDMIKSITDGNGKEDYVRYAPMSDETVYSSASKGTTPECEYPEYCSVKGSWLVAEHNVDNGTVNSGASQNQFLYTYEDARSDIHGRGFIGMGKWTEIACLVPEGCTTSSSEAVITNRLYENGRPESITLTGEDGEAYTYERYPQAGLLKESSTSYPLYDRDRNLNGNYYVTTRSIYEVRDVEDNPRSFITRLKSSRTFETEVLSGVAAEISDDAVTYKYSEDDYSNIMSRIRVTSDGEGGAEYTEIYTVPDYFNTVDDEYWILGMPYRATLTGTSPDTAYSVLETVSRDTSYMYNHQTGLLRAQAIHSNTGQRRQIFYGRDQAGQVTRVTDIAVTPSGNPYSPLHEERITNIEYDTLEDIRPVRVTDPMGYETRAVYETGMGLVDSIIDPNGIQTSFQYDGFGRPKKRTRLGQGTLTVQYLPATDSSRYGNNNSFIIHSQEEGGGDISVTYNTLGLETRRDIVSSDGRISHADTIYDFIAGRVAGITRPYFLGTTDITRFTYDSMGRRLTTMLPDGETIVQSYSGRKMHTLMPTITGAALPDPGDALETEVETDPLGRVVSSRQGGTGTSLQWDESAAETRFLYGAFGTLRSVMRARSPLDEGRSDSSPISTITLMEYDDLGRRIWLSDPDTGDTTTDYNPYGEIKWQTDSLDQTTELFYDKLGRVVREISPDGTACRFWDQAQYGIGRLAVSIGPASLGSVEKSYEYTPEGQLSAMHENVQGDIYTIQRGYDSLWRLETLTYPDIPGSSPLSIQYTYDQAGIADKVIFNSEAAPKTLWEAESRIADGQIERDTFGNGVTSRREYDPRGMLTLLFTALPSTELDDTSYAQKLMYTYDGLGNVIRRYDAYDARDENFGYDIRHGLQLTTWDLYPGTGSDVHVTYRRDDMGNLYDLQDSRSSSPSPTFVYGEDGSGPNALTRMGSEQFRYDIKGNQRETPDRIVDYTTFDLPKQIQTAAGEARTFLYDADQARIAKKGGDADTTYVGALYERRVQADGSIVHILQVPGPDRIVAQIELVEENGSVVHTTTRYLHDDHLGSIDAITDDELQIEKHRYEPFGGRLDDNSASTITRGFTFHEHDDDLGLINMRGRIYDPRTYRFLTPDPVVSDTSAVRSWNPYLYVQNLPLTFTDPSGLSFTDPGPLHGGYSGGGEGAQGGSWHSSTQYSGNDQYTSFSNWDIKGSAAPGGSGYAPSHAAPGDPAAGRGSNYGPSAPTGPTGPMGPSPTMSTPPPGGRGGGSEGSSAPPTYVSDDRGTATTPSERPGGDKVGLGQREPITCGDAGPRCGSSLNRTSEEQKLDAAARRFFRSNSPWKDPDSSPKAPKYLPIFRATTRLLREFATSFVRNIVKGTLSQGELTIGNRLQQRMNVPIPDIDEETEEIAGFAHTHYGGQGSDRLSSDDIWAANRVNTMMYMLGPGGAYMEVYNPFNLTITTLPGVK